MDFVLLKDALQGFSISEFNSHDPRVSAVFTTQNDEIMGCSLFEGLDDGPADASQAVRNCEFDHTEK